MVKLSHKELEDNVVPIHLRDNCASVVVPLNK